MRSKNGKRKLRADIDALRSRVRELKQRIRDHHGDSRRSAWSDIPQCRCDICTEEAQSDD